MRHLPPISTGKRNRLVALTLGLLPAYAVNAGPDDELRRYLSLPLEELMEQKVSISTNSEQAFSKAPSVVSVITAEDIRATGAKNLADVLQSVPGIHVRYSQFGFRPLISFRGTNDKQTLIMVDGAPMSDLMWRAGIFWKGLPTSMIDRVEIIRGPGSALFGTDASAGVINVITKVAGGIDDSEAGLRVGSFDTQNAWMQYGGEWNGFDVAMTADLLHTDGHDPHIKSDAQSRNDVKYGTSASLAPGDADYGWDNADLRLSLARDHWRVQFDYSEHDNLETGMTGAGALDPVTQGDDSRFSAALFYANPGLSDDWDVNAELRYRHIDYSSGSGFQEWPPGYTDTTGVYPFGVFNRMESAEHGVTGEASGIYRGFENHAVTLGAGFRWQDIYRVEQWVNSGVDGDGNPLPPGGPLVDVSDTPFAFAPEKSRTISYAYMQDVWGISEDLELTTGARFDHNSDFGDSFNPRIALVWQASDTVTAKFMYGQAYRAPNFQELYSETSFSLPNSDLDPEESETWELALSYAPRKDLRLGMNLYRYEQRDFISLQEVPGQTKLRYENTGEYDVNGLEFETWWQPTEEVSLSGNYAYNDPDDNQFRAFGSPNHQAYLRADWRFLPDWNWNIQSNWIGDIERNPGDMRSDIDDYFLTDSTLRYFGVRNWEFAFSVRNLFDEDARSFTSSRIPDDLPLPERSFYLEARYDLDGLKK